MKTLWMTITDLLGNPGQSFLLGGPEVLHACPFRACKVAFPQDDEGWKALREHEFDEHERPTSYDWAELHGQQVTILVVTRIDNSDRWLYPDGYRQTELVARAADGTYYFLPFSHYDHDSEGEYKWKPKHNGLAFLDRLSNEPTPSDPALPLLGSADMGESPDDATATRTAAKAGSR